MHNYKLVAIDIDGTLLTDDEHILEETLLTIQDVNKKTPIILATGRGNIRVKRIVEELKINNPMVLANGAELWKNKKEIYERFYLKEEDIHRLHAIAQRYEANFWGYNPNEQINQSNFTVDSIHNCWIKFGFSHRSLKVIEHIRKELSAIDGIQYTSSNQFNIEVSAKDVTKKSGLLKICRYLNIDIKDVVAFGDNLNDLEMIKAVGLGVAMGNATDIIKEHADVVTECNNNNGIAKVLKKYFL